MRANAIFGFPLLCNSLFWHWILCRLASLAALMLPLTWTHYSLLLMLLHLLFTIILWTHTKPYCIQSNITAIPWVSIPCTTNTTLLITLYNTTLHSWDRAWHPLQPLDKELRNSLLIFGSFLCSYHLSSNKWQRTLSPKLRPRSGDGSAHCGEWLKLLQLWRVWPLC